MRPHPTTMKTRSLAAILFATVTLALPAHAERVPVAVVNYSELPVYSHAVTLDHDSLCKKLGMAAGLPVKIVNGDGRSFPLSHGVQDGRNVLWLYLAMAPKTRLDLLVEPAPQWEGIPAAKARSEPDKMAGEISNGVVSLSMAAAGWKLRFSPASQEKLAPVRASNAESDDGKRVGDPADPLLMIDKGGLQFWIDNQSRGRLAHGDPAELGLVNFPKSASVVSCVSSVSPEGVASLTLVRQMSGMAKDVRVTETFELMPGLPILVCRMRWDNAGDTPLWVAYVGSGDGIKGAWGRTLMASPLIQRMKNPLKGYLNGAETRPSWNGGLARVSMESTSMGVGVGLSTLLPTPGSVGQGSMIWGIGYDGFQLNLIDPQVGQFPFLIAPKGKLENGNAFLLTQNGTSVYRQAVDMWSALAAGKTPRLASPVAVFVGGVAVEPQTVGDAAEISPLMQRRDGSLEAAVRMDLNCYFTCSGEAQITGAPVAVIARPLTGKHQPVTLATLTQSGPFAVALNGAFSTADEFPFVLEFKNGDGAITGLSLAETLPVAPEPWSPVVEANLTDIATMFRWRAIPLVVDYDIQWARTADFAAAVNVRVPMSKDQPWFTPSADQLPAAGKWFWRVRGIKGRIEGLWSEPRSFTVNKSYSKKPLIRPVSAENPLFTLEASKWTPFTRFKSDMPAAIRPYVGIVVEGFTDKAMPIQEALKGVAEIPHPFLIRTHPPTQITLADLEWVCQNFPNFIGIQGGETLKKLYDPATGRNGDNEYHRRMVMLLAKYGRFFHEADGTYKDDAWQDLWDRQKDFLKEYGKYIVFTQKNNIIRRQFYTQSAVMGMWLGGITHAHGAWEDGGFYWQNAGFDGIGVCRGERSGKLATMPRMFWSLMCVQGIARGCGIYSFDGQTLMESAKFLARSPEKALASALWVDDYTTTETFKRFVVPLIEATVKHRLIPNKEELLKDIRLAVYNDRTAKFDALAWPHYHEYGPLFAGTYGFKKMGNIDGQLWEFFQNTGRYRFIPVLPQGDVPINKTIRNIPVSQLQDTRKVREVFAAAYPDWYEGDAFVQHAGDTLTVLNGNENTDEVQSFAVPLEAGLVTRLAGKVEVHSYVLAQVQAKGKRFWLQANSEYAVRPTRLSLTCSRKPDWEITPAAAGEALWDEASKRLTVVLEHQDGAVEIVLK